MPTREEIEAARTTRGGWTEKQLAEWGIDWPPPRGWMEKLAATATERTRESAGRCRGFGERRGRCTNPPGVREVRRLTGLRFEVQGLCSACELAYQQNQRDLERLTRPKWMRSVIRAMEPFDLETDTLRRVRRI